MKCRGRIHPILTNRRTGRLSISEMYGSDLSDPSVCSVIPAPPYVIPAHAGTPLSVIATQTDS